MIDSDSITIALPLAESLLGDGFEDLLDKRRDRIFRSIDDFFAEFSFELANDS